MKALIVDDEAEIRQALVAGLRLAKCEQVDVASLGEEALRLALETEYDLVTLDIRMPSVSGLDILPTFRTLLPHSVIAVISAFISDAVSELHREHADLVLQKPFSMDKIQVLHRLAREIAERRAAIRALGDLQPGSRAADAGGLPVEWVQIERPTDRLEEMVRFYRDGLGMVEIAHDDGLAGSEDVMLGLPGRGCELIFTPKAPDVPGPAPGGGCRLFLRLSDAGAVDRAAGRLEELGYAPELPGDNGPAAGGVTVADPDGWRIVLVVNRAP